MITGCQALCWAFLQLFHPHNSIRNEILLSLLPIKQNWGSEKWSDLLKATQQLDEALVPKPKLFIPYCTSSFPHCQHSKAWPEDVLPKDGKQIIKEKNKRVDIDLCHPKPHPGKSCCSAMERMNSRQLLATSEVASASETPPPRPGPSSIWEHKGIQWEQSEEEKKDGRKWGSEEQGGSHQG